MKIRRKIIRRIIIDIACFIGFGLFLITWQVTDAAGMETQLVRALKEKEHLIDYAVEGDIAYTFISTTEDMNYGDRFLILTRKKNGEWMRSYENDFSGLKPWRLRLSDIDGDEEMEILTAVRKTTFYDKEEKNRLFIFNYIEGKLIKKWTGSDIAGSWENYVVGDLVDTKGEEIVFISKTKEGKEKLLVYHWFDFGFLLLAQSEAYEDITQVTIEGENRLCIVYNNEQIRKTEKLQLKNGIVTSVD